MGFEKIDKSRITKRLALLCIISMLASCTNNVAIRGTFPKPLVAKIPIVLGMYYSNEFKNFKYDKDSYQGTDWYIDLGYPNTQLFDQIFGSMFEGLEQLRSRPDETSPALHVNAIAAPNIIDFAMLAPEDSALDFFSVSFKYRIDFLTPEGNLIHSWSFVAYGKARWHFFDEDESVREATMMALRDAAATLALDYEKQTPFTDWLESEGSMQITETLSNNY
jgi:hypothetical protein